MPRKISPKQQQLLEQQNDEKKPFTHKPIKMPNAEEHRSKRLKKDTPTVGEECEFVDSSVFPLEHANKLWPHRYVSKRQSVPKSILTKDFGDDAIVQAKRHFKQALIDGHIIQLNEDACIQSPDELPQDYIGKLVEFFEGVDNALYLTAQWLFRTVDTVMETEGADQMGSRRVFLSNVKQDNPLGSFVRRVKISYMSTNASLEEKEQTKKEGELYCDMMYSTTYHTFSNLDYSPPNVSVDMDSSSTISTSSVDTKGDMADVSSASQAAMQTPQQPDLALLDLYAGCGAMSTGLCMGASLAGTKLVTRWAVDINENACNSLELNHPETTVRNESAEEFVCLLKEWNNLCNKFVFSSIPVLDKEDEEDDEEGSLSPGEFEVEKLLDICYGGLDKRKSEAKIFFKVRWKGYGEDEDTWEPIDGLGDADKCIKEFVVNGYHSKILPLPGTVDIICGGPPCQGVSGYNRFRDKAKPLTGPKNSQVTIFMDIVEYLKPRYVLMENVVDMLKFSNGIYGRYAVTRLVDLCYQTKLGIMAAGSYGLPQVRNRVFLWGAKPSEELPPYPLPTHRLTKRGGLPAEFKANLVCHDQENPPPLQNAMFLGDAISDLPAVENGEDRDARPYGTDPATEFQTFIRLKKDEVRCFDHTTEVLPVPVLYDHQPLHLNKDDYQRVCRIPKQKGADFRNLEGIRVVNNVVQLDPTVERVYLPSGCPLVPDYAISYKEGKSKKPFGRLWWDETVSTVITRAEPHNHRIMHPEQNRVLTIRENARLQGFPDCYKLCGPIKARYIQVGNAVAVPVAIGLGYAFGKTVQGQVDNEPVITLPMTFPRSLARPVDA